MTMTRSAAHAAWILHTIGTGALTLGQLIDELLAARPAYTRGEASRVIRGATHRLLERGEIEHHAPTGWTWPNPKRWTLTELGALELEVKRAVFTDKPWYVTEPPLHPSDRPRRNNWNRPQS